MTRRLFMLASLLSLVLCLATAALWVRSYLGQPELSFEMGGRSFTVRAERGEAELRVGVPRIYFIMPYPNSVTMPLDALCDHHAWGFGLTWTGFAGIVLRVLVVPCWFIVGLTALAPAAWAVHFRRNRRQSRGLRCAGCGYDLRATPNRCPECGAIPAEAKP